MPNVNTKAHVLVRDGFRCRYCGAKLYLAQAVKVLDIREPGRKLWDAHWEAEPLKSNGATVDHIVPEEEGGYDTLDKLGCMLRNMQFEQRQRTAKSHAQVFKQIMGWRVQHISKSCSNVQGVPEQGG